MRTYAGSCLEPRTTIWQVSLVAVDLSSRGQGGLFWCISVCFPGQSSRWYYIPRQLFKTFLMTCQHSTFKNNDDFHSFTRETKRSLMQGVQQRLIIIVLMFCTIFLWSGYIYFCRTTQHRPSWRRMYVQGGLRIGLPPSQKRPMLRVVWRNK